MKVFGLLESYLWRLHKMIDKFFNKKLLLSEASALKKMVVFKISASPTGATVKINGVTTTSVEVEEGSTVTWEVSLSGYYTQTGTEVMGSSDVTKGVTLTNRTKTISVSSAVQNETYTNYGIKTRVYTFSYDFVKGHNYTVTYTQASELDLGGANIWTSDKSTNRSIDTLAAGWDYDKFSSGTGFTGDLGELIVPAGTYYRTATIKKNAKYLAIDLTSTSVYATLSGSIKITDNY